MGSSTDRLIAAFKAGEITMDLKGHYRLPSGPLTYGSDWVSTDRFLSRILSDPWQRVRVQLDGASPDADPVEDFGQWSGGAQTVRLGDSTQCGECGAYMEVLFDGNGITVSEPCTEPGGLKPWDLELDVPSGTLVFRNDMRDLFPTEDHFEVNFTAEEKKCEKHYAALGMFHCYVGNTCPSVYLFEDRVVVGSYLEEDDNDPHADSALGRIVTDLWWFSACDLDVLKARGGSVKTTWPADIVVTLPEGPGRYVLTSYFSTSNRDTVKEYAVIRKADV